MHMLHQRVPPPSVLASYCSRNSQSQSAVLFISPVTFFQSNIAQEPTQKLRTIVENVEYKQMTFAPRETKMNLGLLIAPWQKLSMRNFLSHAIWKLAQCQMSPFFADLCTSFFSLNSSTDFHEFCNGFTILALFWNYPPYLAYTFSRPSFTIAFTDHPVNSI